MSCKKKKILLASLNSTQLKNDNCGLRSLSALSESPQMIQQRSRNTGTSIKHSATEFV